MSIPLLTRRDAWKLRLAEFEALAKAYGQVVLMNDLVCHLFMSDVRALVNSSLTWLEGGLMGIPLPNTPGVPISTYTTGRWSPMNAAIDIAAEVEDFLNQVISKQKGLMARAIRGANGSTRAAISRGLPAVLEPLIEQRNIPAIMEGVKSEVGKSTARYAQFLPRTLYLLGKGILVFGLAVSLYRVVTAENWKLALGRELTSFGFGMAGVAAGGALGGFAGPAAPVAVPLGMFVGGGSG